MQTPSTDWLLFELPLLGGQQQSGLAHVAPSWGSLREVPQLAGFPWVTAKGRPLLKDVPSDMHIQVSGSKAPPV